MTWEIVLGIIALFTFIVTVVSLSNKINTTLVQNTVAINELRTAIETLTTGHNNHDSRIHSNETEIALLKAEESHIKDRLNTLEDK